MWVIIELSLCVYRYSYSKPCGFVCVYGYLWAIFGLYIWIEQLVFKGLLQFLLVLVDNSWFFLVSFPNVLCTWLCWQRWIQCLVCVPCHVCILWPRQHRSQGSCKVIFLDSQIRYILFFCLVLIRTRSDLIYGVFNARFFKESSEEEREHAEKFMEYQVFGYWHLWLSACFQLFWMNQVLSLVNPLQKRWV